MDSGNAGYLFVLEGFRLPNPYAPSALPVVLPAPWPLLLLGGSLLLFLALFFLAWPYCLAPRAGAAPSARVEVVAQWHHGFLCIYSALCTLAMLAYVIAEGELTSPGAFFCAPLASPALRLLSFSFTASKVVEWGDTMVLIARGKSAAQIGTLHAYHHATTFALFLLVVNFPGTEKCGLLLNGGVHTLMYWHYAWRLPRWARPLITAAQIAQLVFVTWAWWVTPSRCAQYADFPLRHPLEFTAPFLMVPVYTLFFLEFFVRTYLCSAGGRKKASKD
jgi:hypothetical protein